MFRINDLAVTFDYAGHRADESGPASASILSHGQQTRPSHNVKVRIEPARPVMRDRLVFFERRLDEIRDQWS